MQWLPCAVLPWFFAAALTPLRADEFVSRGVRIHYRLAGSGEPVVLIHGLHSSNRINWEMPRLFDRLARSYRVIGLDNRGHGQSDRPETPGMYGREMVEDVVRLLDHLGIAEVHVVGYSMGGMIVMRLLADHPERVRSAVVCGMGWLREGSALAKLWQRAPGRNGAGIPMLAPAACTRELGELALDPKEVKAVVAPVTVIVGDRDPVRRLYVESLRETRPDWPVQTIAGAGHLNCILKEEFKDAVEAALDRHSAH